MVFSRQINLKYPLLTFDNSQNLNKTVATGAPYLQCTKHINTQDLHDLT